MSFLRFLLLWTVTPTDRRTLQRPMPKPFPRTAMAQNNGRTHRIRHGTHSAIPPATTIATNLSCDNAA